MHLLALPPPRDELSAFVILSFVSMTSSDLTQRLPKFRLVSATWGAIKKN